MSRAFLRPSLSPKQLHQSSSTHYSPKNNDCFERIIQVWNTTCIVTNFGKKCLLPQLSSSSSSSSRTTTPFSTPSKQQQQQKSNNNKVILINPANPNLSGVRDFPYFPKGGPVPKKQPNVQAHHIMGYVSQWGGMDVGSGMLFPASVVDGLVHQLGGSKLHYECQFHRYTKGEEKACPIGQAIVTSCGGTNSKLQAEYDRIIHTTPPFYLHDGEKEDVVDGLKQCYQNSFDLAFSSHGQRIVGGDGSIWGTLFSSFSSLLQQGIAVENEGEKEYLCSAAVPLLGAGARGFPLGIALDVAASEAVRWRNNNDINGRENEDIEKIKGSIPMNSGRDKASTQEKDYRRRFIVAFGIPDLDIANALVQRIESL